MKIIYDEVIKIADPKQRIQFLNDNSDNIVEKGYMKKFTDDQLSEMKDDLSEIAIEINDIEQEKKAAVKVFKDRMKPLIDEKQRLLTGLKNGSEYVKEKVFEFVYPEDKLVEVYNSQGELIDTRRAVVEELNLYSEGKVIKMTGTNN